MNIPPALGWVIWLAAGLMLVAAAVLTIGLSFLLGTVSHRRVALPLVWVSSSVLVACAVALLLVALNA